MDLKAYMQIEEYEDLLRKNNIEIPRLRGIDLCKTWSRGLKGNVTESEDCLHIIRE